MGSSQGLWRNHSHFVGEADIQRCLDDFRSRCLSLWQDAGSDEPSLGERYSPVEQRANQREADRFVRCIEDQLNRCPNSPVRQDAWRSKLRERIGRFGRDCLRLPERYVDGLFSDSYQRATSSFVRAAWTFNKKLGRKALAQALRNVWVMNFLQMYLGKAVSTTPSVFAYSMLYPYTDNLLDDTRLPADLKRKICRNLSCRLEGAEIRPPSRREQDIYRLIAMIEGEYKRSGFPEVYRMLLAIHRGQVDSLRQQSRTRTLDEHEILNVSFRKGGASVLADAYLVSGRLSYAAARFSFGFGTVLQLFDDLQDVKRDLSAARWTVFSRNAGVRPLDPLASRLHTYMLKVMNSTTWSASGSPASLADVARTNCGLLLLQGVSQNRELFSRDYLRKLESHSPLGFEAVRPLMSTISRLWSRYMDCARDDLLPVEPSVNAPANAGAH